MRYFRAFAIVGIGIVALAGVVGPGLGALGPAVDNAPIGSILAGEWGRVMQGLLGMGVFASLLSIFALAYDQWGGLD